MMKKIYLVLAGFLAFSLQLQAQCADVTLSSQADVNSFQSAPGGCSTLSGVLTISGNDITDLTPLSGITSVGTLMITDNPNLQNLHGLEGIGTVGLNVNIKNNAVLANVDALSHIGSFGGEATYGQRGINIENNPMLTSTYGFNNLQGPIGSLYIINNDALTDITGFDNIYEISGDGLEISGNASLASLSSLQNITMINPGVTIMNNDALTNLDGLLSLKTISLVRGAGIWLVVSGNPSLVDVDGLSNLNQMTGSPKITFTNDPNLTRGCGLFNIINEKETNCPGCVTYDFSGSGITKEQIIAGGPCGSPANGGVCDQRISLTSQAEVDAFPTTHGCSIVTAELQVSGSDIQNLDGLSGINELRGLFHMPSNPMLTDITGLSHVTKAGILSIVYNDALHDLNGLGALETVGSLEIRGMTLTDFSGMTALDSAGTIVLEDNVSIGSLHGLENIEFLDALKISRNASIKLDGLSGLKRVAGQMQIDQNGLMTLSPLANLTSVGSLFIGGNALPNLDGLSSLTTTSSIQILYCTKLQNIQGLSNVRGGVSLLKIDSNPKLTSLHGLEGVTSAGDVIVSANDVLTDLSGLGLYYSGTILVGYNPAMTSLNGLNNLTRIDGGLSLIRNEKLADISALSSITEIKGSLVIMDNAALKTLDGFSSLTSVTQGPGDPGAAFIVEDNSSLMNFNGMQNLVNVNGDAVINRNTALVDVDSLSNWSTIKAGASLHVTGNVSLSRGCGFYNVLHTSNPATSFSGNGPGVTKDAILANGPCKSVDPCNGDIILASQADVDAFATTYECTTLTGTLTITGADIINLDGLSHLISTGALFIKDNPALTDLSGLSHVTSVNGGVFISGNAALKNVNGLQGLKTIQGSSLSPIKIYDNPLLENVDSLKSLTTLGAGATIYVVNNPKLIKGCGLYPLVSRYYNNTTASFTFTGNGPTVTKEEINSAGECDPGGATCSTTVKLISQAQVDNFFVTRSCPVFTGWLTINGSDITNLDSLYRLTSVSNLFVQSNPNLADISGLRNLQSSDQFTISDNNSLDSISLPGLQSVNFININDNDVLAYLDLPALTSGNEVYISRNSNLGSLEGISNLDQVDILVIEDNDKLTSLHGLEGISGSLGIRENDGLTDLSGLTLTTAGSLSITENSNLTSLHGLENLTHATDLSIELNVKLENLDELYSLTSLDGSLLLNGNTALQNVDGLSSLTTITPSPGHRLIVTNNTNLTRGCGFYNVIHTSNPPTFFEGNGPAVNRTTILEQGPCRDDRNVTAPANLTFSNVTDNSMTLSFTAGTGQDGYMVIMRAFESALPNDAPVDGTEYHVGDVLGCCSIIVGMGIDTTYSAMYLEQDVDYYFDVIPYINSSEYLLLKSIGGHQRTMPAHQPYPNPFVEELTIPFTVAGESADVRIIITDQLGRPVSEVVNDRYAKGKHTVKWNRIDTNGNRANTGIYMYQVSTSEQGQASQGLIVAN